MVSVNERLNAIEPYLSKSCTKCQRRYPKVILNIEAHVHHGQPLACVDTVDCERKAKKLKNKK